MHWSLLALILFSPFGFSQTIVAGSPTGNIIRCEELATRVETIRSGLNIEKKMIVVIERETDPDRLARWKDRLAKQKQFNENEIESYRKSDLVAVADIKFEKKTPITMDRLANEDGSIRNFDILGVQASNGVIELSGTMRINFYAAFFCPILKENGGAVQAAFSAAAIAISH